MTTRTCSVRSYTRKLPGRSVEFAKTTVQLFQEVNTPETDEAIDHMTAMLEAALALDIAEFGEDDRG